MLSYIQNKISVIDEETLVRICKTSFSSDEIKNSKSLLFDSIPTDKIKIKRKNKGKEERDLADIVNLFKSTEPDLIPVFVARDLERLPPVLYDHVDCTKLLKDLLRVQTELKDVKSTYVTQDQLRDLRSEFLQLKNDSLPYHLSTTTQNVNKRRGAWLLDSGPMGLSDMQNPSVNESLNNDNSETHYRDIMRVDLNNIVTQSAVDQRSEPGGSRSEKCEPPLKVLSPTKTGSVTSPAPSGADQRQDQLRNDGGGASPHSVNVNARKPLLNNDSNEGWQRVSKRKKPIYRYLGTTGVSKDKEGKFKAAERRIPIFITKVHKDTKEKDIVDYLYKETHEMIRLEKISFKQERDHNAYKFFVPEQKLSMFLNDKLWPEGIIFRRFVNFTQNKTNGVNLPYSASPQRFNHGK